MKNEKFPNNAVIFLTASLNSGATIKNPNSGLAQRNKPLQIVVLCGTLHPPKWNSENHPPHRSKSWSVGPPLTLLTLLILLPQQCATSSTFLAVVNREGWRKRISIFNMVSRLVWWFVYWSLEYQCDGFASFIINMIYIGSPCMIVHCTRMVRLVKHTVLH